MRRAIVVTALGLAAAAAWLLSRGDGLDLPVSIPWAPAADRVEAPPLKPRRLQDPRIDELSGLAASRLHKDVLYGVNDSGGDPVVYAIGRRGRTVAELVLRGAEAVDWEALAPGWSSEGQTPVLWVGDIGDNAATRATVNLYRIEEPVDLVDGDVAWQQYRLAYEDGAHNAEALAVDPASGAIFVITKDSPAGAVYKAEDLSTTGVGTLRRMRAAPASITDAGMELAPDGRTRLVAVDYLRIHSSEDRGRSWNSGLAPLQLQREAVAWPWFGPEPVSDQVYVGTEGAGSRILPAGVPD